MSLRSFLPSLREWLWFSVWIAAILTLTLFAVRWRDDHLRRHGQQRTEVTQGLPVDDPASNTAAWSPTRRLALVTVTVCALGALPILLLTTFAQYTPQGVWTGREGMAPYLQRAGVTPYTNLMDLVQQAVLPGERVLIAGDARGMGYARQVVASSVFDLPLLAEVVKGS